MVYEGAGYRIRITPNDRGSPPGKLADAELHFGYDSQLSARIHEALAGTSLANDWRALEDRVRLLDGLKLVGFSIWERRAGGRNVTFPARSYSVNGERRSFALLRPIEDIAAQDRVREAILEAYAAYEAGATGAEQK